LSDAEQREADQLDGVPLPEEREVVVGHAAARAVIDPDRLPHAFLLHGPRGIGKATLAFDLARDLLVRTGDEDVAQVAAQVAAGSHPNLRVLRKAPRDTGKGFYTAIRIEEVRSLIGESRLTRGRTGCRLVIVDAIDDCNPASANALLKILEEPPSDTLFVLISHRPGGLLPTIRSRCRSIALRPISDPGVREVLGADATEIAVSLAGGRPRRAYEALTIGEDAGLVALRAWLASPATAATAATLSIAEALAADKAGAAHAFGRELLGDWIAEEGKSAATAGARARLASAQALWDKATALFADAEEYNLDARQTLISVMDAIRRHAQTHLSLAETR